MRTTPITGRAIHAEMRAVRAEVAKTPAAAAAAWTSVAPTRAAAREVRTRVGAAHDSVGAVRFQA